VTVVASGKLRYANNSNYKNDTMIRKEVCWTACHIFSFTFNLLLEISF